MAKAKKSAKKGRAKGAEKKPAAAGNPELQATEGRKYQQISPAKLKRLINDKLSTGKSISEQFTGPLGQRIKEAVDKDRLDRQIFNFIASIFKHDDVTLNHKLATLYYYIDASGLEKRAENQGKLALDDGHDKAAPPGRAQSASRNGGQEEEEDGEEDGEEGSLAPASAANVARASEKLN